MLMLSDRSCENSRLQSAKTRGWVVRLALAFGNWEIEADDAILKEAQLILAEHPRGWRIRESENAG